jgi:hypothetical protein
MLIPLKIPEFLRVLNEFLTINQNITEENMNIYFYFIREETKAWGDIF